MTETATSIDTLIEAYVERNPRSRALYERAQRVMPGGNTRTGVWLDPFPPYITRGEGVYLYDADGHELLDFVFNNSSLITGHAHPEVVAAIQEQAPLGTGFSRPTELEIELAEVLCQRVPSFEQVRFCNSGTEAVMNTVRAAIGFTGRRKIAKFEGAYHGISDHALISMPGTFGPDTGTATRPRAVASSVGLSGAGEEVIVLPFNDMESCEALLAEHAHELAAVLIDPLMSNNNVILPEEGFLQRLREVTRELGILLIFDEIVVYRVGPGGVQGMVGVTPDLTALGKIIAGGTPGGAFGGRADIMSLYDPTIGARIPQSGTFNGNPITMVAGLATLRLLTPEVYARMADQAKRVTEGMVTALRDAGIPASGNAVGSIFRIYLTEIAPSAYRETTRDDKAKQRWLFFWLLNQGIHWAQGGYISTVTEDEHLDRLVASVAEAAREM